MQILSERGLPLVGCATPMPPDVTYLTVELYGKWYNLYLIHVDSDGVYRRERLDPELLEEYTPEGQSAVGDHVFNPLAVEALADAYEWYLPQLAHELLIGRWELEYRETSSPYYQEF